MITGLVAIAAGLVFSHPVHAAAPMQKGQAPGFYRMNLGDFAVVESIACAGRSWIKWAGSVAGR